jgi:ribonuclease BN (tRNA processing enzyme)
MRLVFLGTTGYHPNAVRQTACLMIPEMGLVLDAGTGFFRVADYLATPELMILLSHAHVDHVVGLTYLFDVLKDHPNVQVTIRASREHLQAVREHLFHPLLFPVELPHAFETVTDPFDLPGGGTGRVHAQHDHPGESLAYRLTWPGRSMAYVTDTVADPDETEFFEGVDLLVHECYFADADREWAEQTGHSYTSAVAEAARRAGVGRLYLVHMNPMGPEPDAIGLETARATFPETYLATDLLEIEF